MLVYQRVAVHIQCVPLAPGCTRPWGNEERSSWMQSDGNGDKAKPHQWRHLRCTNRMVVWRPKWEAYGSMEACWMLDYDWLCGNMWEPTHATSNWCFAFWFPTGPKNGSYGPCKLQVLILQETRQAIGEERWTQTRKALPRCFKDVQRCSKMFKWFAKPLSSFRPR